MSTGLGAVGSGSAYAVARRLCACQESEDDPDQKEEKKNPWGTVH